ncbi:hypothetical protein ACWIVX_19065 [Enterobacter asburiae]
MKTLTIEWLNKCRCGNKLHTVKTARGNESALWDDDAVKCDSCGRGGVIQVCEGQARVLWETDEEMAENKPMSTITKEFTKEQLIEQAKKNIEVLRGAVEKIPGSSDAAVIHLKLARIALASIEAEPVAFRSKLKSPSAIGSERWDYTDHRQPDAFELENCVIERLYPAPPAPVSVPDDIDARMKNAGMLSAAEIIAGQPNDAFMKHAGVVDLSSLLKWAEMRRAEFLRMQAKYELGDNQKDDMYEWVISHVAAFSELHVNLRAAMLQGADGNSPVIPDGWVMVPVEPTEDMIVNGFESEPDESFSDEKVWEEYDAMSGCQQAAHRAKLCWAAMIAAAPKTEHK